MKILKNPDPHLNTVAKPIEAVTDEHRADAKKMLKTLKGKGIGLAAQQVGLDYRVIVIDFSMFSGPTMAMFNPKIIEASGEDLSPERCLSFNKEYLLKRSSRIKVEFLDVDNNTVTFIASGLLAYCLQHEIDHLDGITMPIRKRMKK